MESKVAFVTFSVLRAMRGDGRSCSFWFRLFPMGVNSSFEPPNLGVPTKLDMLNMYKQKRLFVYSNVKKRVGAREPSRATMAWQED